MRTKVLLIEDDLIFQFLFKFKFEAVEQISNVTTCGDGQEGIDYLLSIASEQEKLPDIVFVDLNMPILDGWGFLKRFEEEKHGFAKDIVCYVLSSSISPHDIKESENFPFVKKHLIKPIKDDDIVGLLVLDAFIIQNENSGQGRSQKRA